MYAPRDLSPHSPPVSPSAAARIYRGRWECGADRMVKIELEAAEALAGLADSAIYKRESETRRGESEIRLAKNESYAGNSGLNPGDSVPKFSDLAEDQAVVVQQHCEKTCCKMTKPVKAAEDAEFKPNPIYITSYESTGGYKSRQNLTEAEKESRKLRRVLANRESARQTIRRRQALYEELTRKAADLALENENLKREKELAMKEYDSLKSTNECLKAQMTKIVKAEVEETEEESTGVEIATSPSTRSPVFIYNQSSFLPFIWPFIIPPSNSVQFQCGPQSGITVPSQVPMPATGKPDSFHEQENPTRTNGRGTSFYGLPCPWFFPLPHRNSGLHPQSFDLNEKQNETSPNNQCSTSSSSKTIAHVENHRSLLSIKVKTEASTSKEAIPSNNLHEIGFPPDGGGHHHIGTDARGLFLMPAPLSCVRPAVTTNENNRHREHTHDVKAISPAAGDIVNVLPEKNKGPVVCPSKNLVDDAAAAEARKKRKELVKLKNLHCRQFRMHA